MRKIFIAFLALVFALSSYVPSVSAETSYGEGSLLKAPDSTTVYYIGPDGKKYVFPEGKTYSTWFDDFSQVQEVTIEELDQYPDGGAMPIKGGARLVTHVNTANVYAVENGGILRRIPNEAKARELFGDDWANRVVDVLPGFFATTYQMGDEVSDTLPNGYLITDGNKYYYVENGEKSLMTKEALRLNNLKEDNALRIKNINRYKNKAAISVQKRSLANFVPPLSDVEDKKVRVCHNGHTISISKNALKAHIRIGDSLGTCGDKADDPEDPEEEPTEVEPGAWCSVLLGMFNSDTLGYASDNPHDVLDINDDGVVNLSDNAMLVDLYNNEDNQACFDHIEDSYTENNYQNLDWCNGLVQGISDNLGDTSPFDPFDLNDDDKINLSDVAMVATYLYEGDQAQCYSEYDGYLDEIVDPDPVDNDADDDGYDSEASGGEDCNDNDSDINPGADEIADDGIDQDCDGEDLVSSVDMSISSVSSDDLDHGQTYTINVSGVTDVANIEPLLWDNVEDSYDGYTIEDGQAFPVDSDVSSGYPWRVNVHENMYFATEDTREQRGVSTAHYINDSSIDNHGTMRGYDYNPEGLDHGNPEMYISWNIKTNSTSTSASTKMLRLWAGDHNGRTYRLSWTTMLLGYGYAEDVGVEGDEWAFENHDLIDPQWRTWSGENELNQWHRNELYYRQSSSYDTEDGKIYATTDGNVEYDIDLSTWLEPWDPVEGAVRSGVRGGADPLNNIWLMGFDPSVSIGDYTIELDDFYINNTRARVEICDVSDFDSREGANCEIQPASSWEDGQISFTANQGILSGTNYLFVIDEDGNASDSYPISF